MSKTKFPITIRRGNARAKIHFTPSNGCDSFTVAHHFAGKRQRRAFADLATANQEAELAATKICACELDAPQLMSADRAMEMLRPLELAVMPFVETAPTPASFDEGAAPAA